MSPPAPGTGSPPGSGPPGPGLWAHSVRSGTARLAGRAGLVVVGIASTAVLARLLTPEDFGLVAMVLLLTALVQSFRHFGLPMAVVHEDELDDEELDALFRLNVKLSLAVFVGMVALSPGLAWMFDEPRLVAIAVVLAFGKTALGLAAQHMGLLMREMRFATLAWIDVGGAVVGAVLGVAAALLGAGYWALVVQLAAAELTQAGAWWWRSGWRPRLRRVVGAGPAASRTRVSRAIRFAGNHSGASVLTYVGRKVDRILIGVFGGASALGLYDLAFKWSFAPMRHVYPALEGVAVAGLSRVRGEEERFRRFCRRSLLPVLGVVLPALAFLAAEPAAFVRTLLGDQWLEAIPLVRLLALAGIMRCFGMVLPWLYLAEGRTRRQLGWSIIQTPVLVAATAVGIQWGAVGVAAGLAAATALLTLPELAWGLRGSRLRAGDVVQASWRPTVASAAAALAVVAARSALPLADTPPVVVLVGAALFFSLLYLGVWLALPGGVAALREVASLLDAFRDGPGAPRTPVGASAPRT